MLRQENLANNLSLLLPLVPVLQSNAVLCLVCPSCVAVPQWTGGQVQSVSNAVLSASFTSFKCIEKEIPGPSRGLILVSTSEHKVASSTCNLV